MPGLPGIYAATGHGMLGVTLAAITAELLAPLILEDRVSPVLAPFLPARFAAAGGAPAAALRTIVGR